MPFQPWWHLQNRSAQAQFGIPFERNQIKSKEIGSHQVSERHGYQPAPFGSQSEAINYVLLVERYIFHQVLSSLR